MSAPNFLAIVFLLGKVFVSLREGGGFLRSKKTKGARDERYYRELPVSSGLFHKHLLSSISRPPAPPPGFARSPLPEGALCNQYFTDLPAPRQITSSAPNSVSISEQTFTVAPLVIISSTRTTLFPFIFSSAPSRKENRVLA